MVIRLLILSLIVSCGQLSRKKASNVEHHTEPPNKPDPTENVQPIRSYKSESEVPSCDASREEHLIFVRASSEFKLCSGGLWQVVDLRGAKGDAGVNGRDGQVTVINDSSLNKAFGLYKLYRRSVFRITVGCGDYYLEDFQTKQWGSGFRCGDHAICTNKHVLDCGKQPFRKIIVEQVASNLDSLGTADGDEGREVKPGFFESEKADFVYSATRDLAKVTNVKFPEGVPTLPVPSEPWPQNIEVLDDVLSLSFPLGFQDLYIDLGRVNSKYIAECRGRGPASPYGCLKNHFDFATSNNTDHGSSGSPLINVRTGSVVGVASGGTNKENANFTWAVDSSEFTRF